MQRLRLDLDPLRETLLLTLYARALDSKLPRPILGDADSAALGDTIDYDFAKLELKPNLICGTALRAKKLDDAVREFVAAHPRAVVLDLGCGLDTRVLRCDPPAGVDLTEPGWLDPLPRDRPAMIVAEGLLPFLPGDTFRRLTSELTAHFDTGELAINGYTRFAAWSMKYHPAIKAIGITAAQDFDDPRTPEAWNAGLTLVEEQLLTRAPEVADFPQPLRAAPRLISYSTALSRQGTRILRYRLLTVTLARLRSLPAAVHSGLVDDRGLASDGTIAREGSLDGVPAEFAPVVEALRVHVAGTFSRLHSAYLYGSIPRGTAVPGVSDLDALLAFHDEPTDADRADARRIEAALDRAFPQINGAGIQLAGVRTLLSDAERHDGGFFVACLCTPLLGDDLAERLPSYRPTSLLARETNGNLAALLPGWRQRAAAAATDHERRTLSRSVSRRLVRTGFTLVMSRWGGWTSDLDRSAELFGRYYPERLGQMRKAAVTARAPTADPAVLGLLIDDLGPWLAAEYTATHGERAPRP